MRLLLDEMYPPALAAELAAAGIEALTAVEASVAGRPDADVLDAAITADAALLTENVADFARIAADRLTAGLHHTGILIALSTCFSRRPAGRPALVKAIGAVQQEEFADRVAYLKVVAAE